MYFAENIQVHGGEKFSRTLHERSKKADIVFANGFKEDSEAQRQRT
jgi:hypothetical protein